ncbi:hypothetical protein SDC9_189963 [bioreactor metagenome]|uniref:Uncharacterized protein n=1 Tax=bioreactor metagenome TaxID=1076179 RepID=A0A645HV06_9ZZZZ
MNHAKHCIAFHLGINEYPYGVEVIYFVEILVLGIHFFINAVNGFDSAFNGKFDILSFKVLCDYFLRVIKKILVCAVFPVYVALYFLVSDGIKILHSENFKL